MRVLCKGDVGGQKTLRSYWRNYFEKTDALIWVVDANDRHRVADCREELAGLLLEEVIDAPKYCRATLNTIAAASFGSELTGLFKQDRCGGMHEQRGDSRGECPAVGRK